MDENLTVMGIDADSDNVIATAISYTYTEKEPEYKVCFIRHIWS